MANEVSDTGVTIQTLSEIRTEITDGTADFAGLKTIYGPNINLEANSPDGQMVALIAQGKRDMLEFCQQIFNSFDPDQATGASLDQRVAINGLQRNAGTYTQVYVTVTATQACTLAGATDESPFTIAGEAGAEFVLVDSYTFAAAGSASLLFRASVRGAVSADAGTLTSPVSIVLGVASVTNPSGPIVTGTAEETDAQLRVRRANSVSMPARGYRQAMWAAIKALDQVTECVINENYTDSTDSDGIPAHSIWAVVKGGGVDAIADTINRYRPPGCGMKGAVSIHIEETDEATGSGIGRVDILFDRPTNQNLYVKFNIAAITGTVDVDWIRTQILNNVSHEIGAKADSAKIVAYVKGIAPNATIYSEGVSGDGVTYTNLLAPTGLNYQFQMAASRISINGVTG